MNILEKLKNKPNPKKQEELFINLRVDTPDISIKIDENQKEIDKEKMQEKDIDKTQEDTETTERDKTDEKDEKDKKQVKVQKESLVKNLVVDKTKENLIDREEFIKSLTSNKQLKKPVLEKQEQEVDISQEIKKPAKKIKSKIKLTRDDSLDVEVEKISKQRKPKKKVISEGPLTMIKINDQAIGERLPKPEKKILIESSAYYLNNREIFQNFVATLFLPYKEEFESLDETTLNCDNRNQDSFNLLLHQKLVRDYINVYTPYRGLLLYHGLGSGKTCTSIAIAEGIKNDQEVIVMTPASLRANYVEELKKCGDDIYKKKQYWEFIPVDKNPELIPVLSNILKISQEFIKKSGGAWLVNITKPSNFDALTTNEKSLLDIQLKEMIAYKYRFINYNGMRLSHLREISKDFNENPFSNKVVIIDEAHNFISRIVNKIKKPETLPMRLYKYLMEAENVKIVFLTGTPIINYPNEIAVLYNILRGYIKTWNIPLNIKTGRKVDKMYLKSLFQKVNVLDFMDYQPSTKMLTITRNPFGFIDFIKYRQYKGVKKIDGTDKFGGIRDSEFEKNIFKILNDNEIEPVRSNVKIEQFKALPDDKENFNDLFIDETNGTVKNKQLFQKRILGLTSYFKSAQEQLLPRFDKSKDYKVIEISMSNYQFGEYEKARVSERKLESKNAQKRKKSESGLFEETVSTYRIFSRAFCNFVFPNGKRPMPQKEEDVNEIVKSVDEDVLDAVSNQDRVNNTDGTFTLDDVDDLNKTKKDTEDTSYEDRIKEALLFLKNNSKQFLIPEQLKIYSPKFLSVLQNIQDDEYRGLHLVYSQFRTLEGIGIFKLILEANGFTEFKIKRDGLEWKIDIKEENKGKPTFALYTGTESTEEKEILRNIYNGTWNLVPESIVSELRPISSNNIYGEIIKVFMITASGAEGINLRNTRYVHIMEPYWHPVRVKQVIGRAQRICSHQDLPEKFRTVEVFIYVMKFDEQQLKGDETIELRLKDRSKIDNLTPLTSDQALLEIMNLKEGITDQILHAVKESSIDCTVYSKSNSKEKIKCFSFGKVTPKTFSYFPSIHQEEVDTVTQYNKTNVTWTGSEIEIKGKKYIINKKTNEVYDFESFRDAEKGIGEPLLIGVLKKEGNNYKFESM